MKRASGGTDSELSFPQNLLLHYSQSGTPLRYGENPHQRAAFYVEPGARGPNLATARGFATVKSFPYNNLLDLGMLRLVRSFAGPAACIIKHNNPCGAAIAAEPATAFERAYEGDPVSAFGGIVAAQTGASAAFGRSDVPARPVPRGDPCPGFDDDAFEWLTTKPTWRNSVRLLDLAAEIAPGGPAASGFDLRRIEGGLLVQSWDSVEPNPAAGQVATKRAPSDTERGDLDFAWRVCAAVKSNAIVLAKDGQLLGVGAGQMSRLDSVRIAIEKAGPRAKASVLASDAFFPFRDGPDLAASHGVTAIIQPGGSRATTRQSRPAMSTEWR